MTQLVEANFLLENSWDQDMGLNFLKRTIEEEDLLMPGGRRYKLLEYNLETMPIKDMNKRVIGLQSGNYCRQTERSEYQPEVSALPLETRNDKNVGYRKSTESETRIHQMQLIS